MASSQLPASKYETSSSSKLLRSECSEQETRRESSLLRLIRSRSLRYDQSKFCECDLRGKSRIGCVNELPVRSRLPRLEFLECASPAAGGDLVNGQTAGRIFLGRIRRCHAGRLARKGSTFHIGRRIPKEEIM